MSSETISCKIEHHAVLFALLSKYAMTLAGDEGKDAIQTGMIAYGRERGARMAANAAAHGDELTTMTSQVYGEWLPDYEGQMECGWLQTEPTFQTYVTKCAWCEAWKKHGLLAYGKYYCVNVDNAVYQGFRPDFSCHILKDTLSFGGTRCEFDWGHPLTLEDVRNLEKRKAEIGTSCTKDFNFHTAHLLHTVGNKLKECLGDVGEEAVQKAIDEYIQIFGQEYFDVLKGVQHGFTGL